MPRFKFNLRLNTMWPIDVDVSHVIKLFVDLELCEHAMCHLTIC
jgi:hypothetical protein